MQARLVKHFFHEPTNTFSYLVMDPATNACAILETHVHADHLSAAAYLQEKLGGSTGIGKKIVDVQEIVGKAFNA